jgi:hypothetical protein
MRDMGIPQNLDPRAISQAMNIRSMPADQIPPEFIAAALKGSIGPGGPAPNAAPVAPLKGPAMPAWNSPQAPAAQGAPPMPPGPVAPLKGSIMPGAPAQGQWGTTIKSAWRPSADQMGQNSGG